MKILITGGAGSLGEEVIKKFDYGDNQITCVINNRCLGVGSDRLVCYHKNKVLTQNQPLGRFDCIIHCATKYGRTDIEDEQIYECNVELPVKLLEMDILGDNGIFINSDTFFNTKVSLPGNMNLYSQTKKKLRDHLIKYAKNGNVTIVNCEIHQMFSINDDDAKFIPSLMKKILNGEQNIPMTPGLQTRDFISAESVAEIYLRICRSINKSLGFWNIQVGNGVEVSIKEFAQFLAAELNDEASFDFGALPYRENEIMKSVADTREIMQLGFVPKQTLHEIFDTFLNYKV